MSAAKGEGFISDSYSRHLLLLASPEASEARCAGGSLASDGTTVPAVSSASDEYAGIPRYRHIIEIMMENTSYSTIIGNPFAPRINALATQHGLAMNYFGVTHPSEPNYLAAIAGDYFGIQDDNAFYCTPAMATTDPNCTGTTVNHTIDAPTLADQLTAAGLTWEGYFQNLPPMPPAGQLVSTGPNANGPYTFKWPSDTDALYASKHNPFLNFTGTHGALYNMVPDTQLFADLADNTLPNFGFVVPDQCHDMHGTAVCSDPNSLVSTGDTYVGNVVDAVMAAETWQRGRNAIVITWDEDDYSDRGLPGTGCCGADPGGGHVVTIVIISKSHGHVTDGTAYNHYSLLRTIEAAFGLPPLAHAGDSVVPMMTPLFRPEH